MKGTKVRDQDKFMLRLPDGLRDRIKVKADVAGISMNEAIVAVLNREFPEPITLESRLQRLLGSLHILKGEGADLIVDDLLKGVVDVLGEIATGAVSADQGKREQVQSALDWWEAEDKARVQTESDVVRKLRLPPEDEDF